MQKWFFFFHLKCFPLCPLQGFTKYYSDNRFNKHNKGQSKNDEIQEWEGIEKKAERHGEVKACTYWARRGRVRGPPSRNPQRSARCWTWWRLQRRRHSDQTPAWKAPRESTLGVDQTLETEKRGEKRRVHKCLETVTSWEKEAVDVQSGERDHSTHCFLQTRWPSCFKGGQ